MGALESVAAHSSASALPLSAAQLGIWLGQALDRLSPAYWTAEAIELRGTLDIPAFETAVGDVINAAETLHMRFESDGEQVWQYPQSTPWHVRHVSIASENALSTWEAAWAWIQEDLRTPPNLNQGPLFAISLLHLGPEHYLWVMRVHHIALDGYGYALLVRRITECYQRQTAALSTPLEQSTAPQVNKRPAGLTHVVQEALAYQQQAQADRHFWLERLRDAPPPVTLAPAAPFTGEIRRLRHQLPSKTLEQWQAAAGQCQVDWPAWLIAAIAAWITRHTGATELTLGLPVMMRLGSHALTVPCMAMNILPLRIRVEVSTGLRQLTQQVAEELRQTRPHQRYRYEWLKQDLAPTRGRSALFGPVINLMPFERPNTLGTLQAIHHPVSAGPVEDLSINIVPHTTGLRLDFEANAAAYTLADLTQLQTELLRVLDGVALASPDTPLEAVIEGPRLSMQIGEPLTPSLDLLSALQAHAARIPNRPALAYRGVHYSYGELLQSVYRLAGILVSRGVVQNTRVAVLLPREPETIIALLAILWAGGGYVPLDPESPPARLDWILEDAEPTLILSYTQYAAQLAQHQSVLWLDQPWPVAAALSQPCLVSEEALAYIIYTSGTTGRPNGVMVGRTALTHFMAGARQRYAMQTTDRVLQFAPLHFDASVEEIFLSLTCGACLVLRTDDMLESIPQFLAQCQTHAISVLDLPTAFWHEVAYALSPQVRLPDSIRLVIIGGEAALAERVLRWRAYTAPSVVLLNTYGPTETTVICTTAQLAGPNPLDWEGDIVPIGQPLPGTQLVVVDEQLRPVRYGESGELCVLGKALAQGYWKRPTQTEARFVPLHHWPHAPRAYRTGDRVQMREDGVLIYLGRRDHEFKISGYRIDPSEIETALLEYSSCSVSEAAVIGLTLAHGLKRLVAFVVIPTADESPSVVDWQQYLASRLPAPAIPSAYLTVSRLPRNANNKIDRTALRTLAEQHFASQSHHTGQPTAHDPVTALAYRIIEVWSEVLGASELSPDSDFFALGGSSLQAIQVANRLSVLLQREVPVSYLFRYMTPHALAVALDVPIGHQPPTQQHPFAPVLRLQSGYGPALFCLPPTGGLSWCYMGLGVHLRQAPIYGLQAPPSTPPSDDLEELLSYYLTHIRTTQPQGPYHLLGWSAGGGLAHSLAARLQAAGETVALLAMMDAYPADAWRDKPLPTERDALLPLLDIIGDSAIAPDGTPLAVEDIYQRLHKPGTSLMASQADLPALVKANWHAMTLYRQLKHPVFMGNVLYFLAGQSAPDSPDWQTWRPYIQGTIEVTEIAANHHGMSRPLALAQIGQVLATHWPTTVEAVQ